MACVGDSTGNFPTNLKHHLKKSHPGAYSVSEEKGRIEKVLITSQPMNDTTSVC